MPGSMILRCATMAMSVRYDTAQDRRRIISTFKFLNNVQECEIIITPDEITESAVLAQCGKARCASEYYRSFGGVGAVRSDHHRH